MKQSLLFLPLLLAACGGDGGSSSSTPRPQCVGEVAQPEPAKEDWNIGPCTGLINYSKGLPLHPTSNPDGSFYFVMGEPHYVTGPARTGKTMTLSFRLSGPDDAVIHGTSTCRPESGSSVFLFFSGDGLDYRWWSKAATPPLKVNTDYTLSADLVPEQWGPVVKTYPHPFQTDLARATRMGFTFANCQGKGHGAYSSKPVTVTVTKFEVK